MELDFLKKIVKEAEKISQKDFKVRQKDEHGDLVTNLDEEIEQYLVGEIKQNYPDFDIVSEEFNAKNKITKNCFVIDPIDGTVNFVNGLPLWGIQVACIKDGETVASVIDLPKLGEFYWADKTGAYLNGEKITVREVPIKNALWMTGKDEKIAKMFPYTRNFRFFCSASVTMAMLASGRLHGIKYGFIRPWDLEPGLFLCKMAGAKIKNEPGCCIIAMNQEFLEILEKELGG